MTPFLHTVTISGIDKYSDLTKLSDLQAKFPFVEWGVLLSKSREGQENRYPPKEWTDQLAGHGLRLSGHICGGWARNLAGGGQLFAQERGEWLALFRRIQLNVSTLLNDIDAQHIRVGMAHIRGPRIIVQLGKNSLWERLLEPVLDSIDLLFDASGGRGLLTEGWPAPLLNGRLLPNCGYAGGLSPDNLRQQIQAIQAVSLGMPAWIDVESSVRTDEVLDLDKVTEFLTIAQPYVLHGAPDANHSSAAPPNPISG